MERKRETCHYNRIYTKLNPNLTYHKQIPLWSSKSEDELFFIQNQPEIRKHQRGETFTRRYDYGLFVDRDRGREIVPGF